MAVETPASTHDLPASTPVIANIKPVQTEVVINGNVTITGNETPDTISKPSAADEEPLFTTAYISQEVASSLPENYTIRPLCRSDYQRGFLDVLSVLTRVGECSLEEWNERYDWMYRRNDEYYLLVICDGTGRIVGTGSLIVERKFIHSLGLVGHIEDIAVESGQQGKKLGLRMIHALDHVAKSVGCYKVCFESSPDFLRYTYHIAVLMLTYVFLVQSILDCSEVNEGFYLKCGFRRAGLEMAHYY